MAEPQADIAMIGLAVMGQNLIMNMNDHGYTVACFNRTTAKVDAFLNDAAKGSNVIGCHDLKTLFASLKRPRKVMVLVKAGQAVDDLIEECLPYMEKGDIFIDGGNSHFPDTQRRYESLNEKGILFVGCGVSGGEEGARHGPSLMPGGHPDAWKEIKSILQNIAAKADNGEPCCDWVGSGGAGHYVKMVHNGIEYGDIQLICEGYAILKHLLGYDNQELSDIFKGYNKGVLGSYLVEIASDIFSHKDQDSTFLLDKILDVAGQKGTGKWTAQSALDEGVPVTLIGEAVFARCLSAMKEQRVALSKEYKKVVKLYNGDKKEMITVIEKALYAAKVLSYAQGFMLMREASEKYKWDLNFGALALMWRGGCIIRSVFLNDINKAYVKNSNLESLLFDDFFKAAMKNNIGGLRKLVALGVEHEMYTPALSSALSFFDGITAEKLPANLLQALRDYFGAHTFERIDQPRGQFFHENWTGTGGDVSSSTYNA